MILLLPYQRLVFESPLRQEEVIRRLSREVSQSQQFQSFARRTAQFEGTISDTGFEITRIIRYRNSFLPIIHGRFYPRVKGVRIEVSMRLQTAVLVFCGLWLSIVGWMAMFCLLLLLDGGTVEPAFLIPIAMLLFFYLLVAIGFGIEANKARTLLGELFAAAR